MSFLEIENWILDNVSRQRGLFLFCVFEVTIGAVLISNQRLVWKKKVGGGRIDDTLEDRIGDFPFIGKWNWIGVSRQGDGRPISMTIKTTISMANWWENYMRDHCHNVDEEEDSDVRVIDSRC